MLMLFGRSLCSAHRLTALSGLPYTPHGTKHQKLTYGQEKMKYSALYLPANHIPHALSTKLQRILQKQAVPYAISHQPLLQHSYNKPGHARPLLSHFDTRHPNSRRGVSVYSFPVFAASSHGCCPPLTCPVAEETPPNFPNLPKLPRTGVP